MTNYHWIDLVSRNIDCSTITADEFTSAMFSDFLEAQEKYNELYIPEWEANKLKTFELYMECTKKNAIKFAEKKWKTERKRNMFINSAMYQAKRDYKMNDYYSDLGFFDFDVNPGEMGLSGNCCIGYKNLTYEKLLNCFNEIKDNKYFKQAKGWKFTYEASENSYRCSFRPQIKLIVNNEVAAQMKKDADDLTASVNKFYENCHYWGD